MELQERIFLLLKNDRISVTAKQVLKSPLGLAKDLIILLNEHKIDELKENLDTIKQFVAGIKRAEYLSDNYQLAKYYPTMFAFHQYFNSSFRARQGKVLEVILQEILKEYTTCSIVPNKVREMRNEKQQPKAHLWNS